MNTPKTAIATTLLTGVTVLLAVIGLYVEQRREFHHEISETRRYFTNILLEVDKDADERTYKVDDRIQARMDRLENRHMRILEVILQNRERLLRLEAGNEEWRR